MRYAYVKDGNIIQKNVLPPQNWNNISNFNLLNDAKLKEYGWVPYTFINTTLNENEVFTGTVITITDSEVTEVQQKRALTQEEIDNNYEKETYALNSGIREMRNIFLKDSDWTQLADVSLPEAKRQEWATYRQALRDLPQNTPDPRNVSWPPKPLNN